MMTRTLFLLASVLLVSNACSPRDVPVGRNNSPNSSGGGSSSSAAVAAVIEADGERSPTCPENLSDYGYLFDSSEVDPKVFQGQIYAVMAAGDRNCFRIGAEVSLLNSSKSPAALQGVKAKVTKAEIIFPSRMTGTHSRAMGTTVAGLKSAAEAMIQKAVDEGRFNPKGVVNMTFFELVQSTVPGGAVSQVSQDQANQTAIDNAVVEGPILLFAQEGERSSTCPATAKDYSFLSTIVMGAESQIQEEQVTAALSIGDRNCYKIGAILPLKDQPQAGQFMVTQVQIVPFGKLNNLHARALNMSLTDLKSFVETEINKVLQAGTFDPKGTVTITFFEKQSI